MGCINSPRKASDKLMSETIQEQNKVTGMGLEKDPEVHSGDRAGDQHSYGAGD